MIVGLKENLYRFLDEIWNPDVSDRNKYILPMTQRRWQYMAEKGIHWFLRSRHRVITVNKPADKKK